MAFDYAQFAAAFPWFLPAFAFVLGACVGSFLNVVIYRVPAGQSVVTPGSHCACGAPIVWYDNLPILSWFLLRGRARCCGRKFSPRYSFVELLTAFLFLACALEFSPARAIAGMVFLSVLVAATFIDLDHWIIPVRLTLVTIALGLAGAFLVPGSQGSAAPILSAAGIHTGLASLVGMAVGAGLIFWVASLAEALLKKEAMGLGDAILVALVGAFSGWQGAVFALFGGGLVGTVWFAAAMVWEKFAGRRSPLATLADAPPYQPSPTTLAPWEIVTLATGAVGVLLSIALPALQGQHSGVPPLDSIRAGVLALRGLLVGSGAILLVMLCVDVVLPNKVLSFGVAAAVGAIGAFGGWRNGVSGTVWAAVYSVVCWLVCGALGVAWARLRQRHARVSATTDTSPEASDTTPALGIGVHVPFGPMLAIAGALHFLFLHRWVAAWFAQIGDLL